MVLDHTWAEEVAAPAPLWAFEDAELGGLAMLPGNDVGVGTSDGDLVVVEAGTGRERWRASATERIRARPVADRNRLFVGSVDGFIRAYNRRDGQALWKFETGGPINAAVALAGDTVLVSNSLNRLFALDAVSGEFKWRREREKSNDYTMLGQSAPLVVDDTVYVGFSDGHVMAYAVEDGATLWGRDISHGATRFRDVDSDPVLYRGSLLVSSFAGGLHRLDPASGEIVWRLDVEAVSTVVPVGDTLYATSRLGVMAMDFESGEVLWIQPFEEERISSAPAVGTRHIFVGLRDRGLLVLDRQTGEPITIVATGTGISSSPLLATRRLYALSNGGMLYAFKVADVPIDN